jgi:pimeloyl-ACP methyl ester carboxylesterase
MQVLLPNKMNGVCGISSGARGAALLAMDKPEVFKVVVVLSGDFNPSLLESDKLMNLFYGKFTQFKQRWLDNDNVYSAASSFQVPILLLHGAKDNVVSVKQSTSFHKELKRVNPSLKTKLIVDSLAGHTYSYWGKQTKNILLFIDQVFMTQKNN